PGRWRRRARGVSAGRRARAAPRPAPGAAGGDHTPAGLWGAPGIASGPARHFTAPDPEIPAGPAGDPEAEWEALTHAREQVRDEIRTTRDSVAAQAGDYSAAIFDAHLLFLDDDALLRPARRALFDDDPTAPPA